MNANPEVVNEKSDIVPLPEPRKAVLSFAANELVFAVVGHAGSGTSTIAGSLDGILRVSGGYDTHIIKARDVIRTWALANGRIIPEGGDTTLAKVEAFQDFGDEMRKLTPDYSSVAKAMILEIRRKRAELIGQKDIANGPVLPDGQKRAYILDSIRHPAEVELLRHVYQDAFVLIGVVCEEDRRLERLTKKYADAGEVKARQFMRRDAKAGPPYGQRVADAFHLADFFLDNTTNRLNKDSSSNVHWNINDELGRLKRLVAQETIVRPEISETAMHHATAAAMRSACLSRQVGAALVDGQGNLIATGTNEVPQAGGGVYGESFAKSTDDHGKAAEDHRCAFRRLPDGKRPFCSNNIEQNELVEKIVNVVPELNGLDGMRRLAVKKLIRENGIGDLIEFSRAVHAEMDALLSAGRTGTTTVGARLFVTTFPCHYCARHIVSSGVDEVQYIEPYPKSRAFGLHRDAIELEAVGWLPPSEGGSKVLFRNFVGVAPRLYRRVFLKTRDLKNEAGVMEISDPPWGSSMLLRAASYVELEAALAKG